jgi:hypothetical protein
LIPFYSRDPADEFRAAERRLAGAQTREDLFYSLNDAAKLAVEAHALDRAELYSNELLELSGDFKENWNFGNAIFDGNMVLGRVALRRGNIEEAKRRLLKAVTTPGSPQLDSFGPNMALARELIKEGEGKVVQQYLDLCRRFWKMDDGRLTLWSWMVKVGLTPSFGANLRY